jgi:hypothetical protein
VNRWMPLLALIAGGCWTTELPELEPGVLDFAPRGAEAPENWAVQAWPQADMLCPDGQLAQFWLVYPVESAVMLPAAVVFHDNALDYSSDSEAPNISAFRAESQLTADHATLEVFDLMGMGTGSGSGALVAALAQSGHMVVLPSNCWGDLYANGLEQRPNDPAVDGFVRRGFDSAEFGFRMVSDEAWATINRVALPVPIDYSAPVAIGIGDGGRAVSELLGEEFTVPTAVLDAPLDDVSAYYEQPGTFPNEAATLDRLFTDVDDANVASLANTIVAPGRTAYLWSRLDPKIPSGANNGAIDRLNADGAAWIVETGSLEHAPLANDATLAADVTTWIASAPAE